MLDVEEAFLYCIPGQLQDMVRDGVRPDLIADPIIREVFEWGLTYLQEHKQSPTQAVLEYEFQRYNLQLEEPQAALDFILEKMRERFVRDKAQKSVLEVGRSIVKNPQTTAKSMIEQGRKLDSILTPAKDIYRTENIDKAQFTYHKRVAKGRGPSLGFQEIDDHFDGMEALTFLCAPPKGFKTWVMIRSMLANILAGRSVYLSGLEMPEEVYDARLRCMAADVPFWKWLKRRLEPEDWQLIADATEAMRETGGEYIIEKQDVGLRSPSYLQQRAITLGADVLYVDQLQYVENRGTALGATNDTKHFFEACNEFKDLSDDIPIFLVHQFNRTVQGSDDFPVMQQIKSSSAIEETATLVMGLHANKAMRDDNVVHYGALASRNYGKPIWEIETKMQDGCSLALQGIVI